MTATQPSRFARWGRSGLSIEAIYDEHVWQVYGFFAYRLDSRSDAEDLTQATFERAVRAFSRYDARRATVATWLLAIARNLLIDHYRRTQGKPGSDAIGEDGVHSDLLGQVEGPDAAGVGLDPDLATALGALGPADREILALRYGGDLTGPEIAEITGLSLANVQQRLSRSLRRLRGLLEESRALSG